MDETYKMKAPVGMAKHAFLQITTQAGHQQFRIRRGLMESQEAVQKPKSVTMAVKILWVSFALGLVKMTMDFSSLSKIASTGYIIFVMFFTLVLIGYLILRISAGDNWARIAFLVMFIIGLLPTLPALLAEFSRSPAVAALSATQIGLQVYALVLLYTQPGSGWFRKAVERANGVD